jgi:bifunctional DNase/RNase
MVEMTVESVRINLATGQRVVILKDLKVDRYLFIWIANAEAYAIARIVIDANGRHVEVDSRPSDAIALAVRAKVPIFVSEQVLERAGVTLESQEEQQEQQKQEKDNLEVYRDFINTLDVLDEFGKSD